MNWTRQETTRTSLLAALVLIAGTLMSCAEKPIDFELTGTVYDDETKLPIEGAYVIAIYKAVAGDWGGVASHCVKTKGMYTGKDGKFRFPVEKRDGYSPWLVDALHMNFEFVMEVVKPPKIHRAQKADAYTDRDIHLRKLDQFNRNPRLGEGPECPHARNKDDVAASVEYLKIERARAVKLNLGQGILDGIDKSIERHEHWMCQV